MKKETIAEPKQESAITADELLKNGTQTLVADSREAIYEKAKQLVGMIPEGVNWTRGIVEHDAECTEFTQTYILIKTD